MTHAEETKGLPSASNMAMHAACQDSFNMLQKYGDTVKPDKLAFECTDIHRSLETGDRELLSDEQALTADELARMRDEFISRWMTSWAIEVAEEPVKEHRLWIQEKGEPVASAKLDFYNTAGDKALVLDYTCGYEGKTPVESNWQIMTQVVALKQSNPQLTVIDAAIPHFRLSANPGNLVSYTEDDLMHARKEILHVLWKIKQPNPTRQAGTHCRYCPGKAFCKSHAAYVALDVLPVPDKEQAIMSATMLTIPQLVNFWFNKRKLIEPFIDACKTRLDNMTDDELREYGIQRKPSTRTYVDPHMGRKLLQGLSLTEQEVDMAVTLSTEKAAIILADKLRQVNPKATKVMAEQKIKEVLKPVTDEIPGNPRYTKIKQ